MNKKLIIPVFLAVFLTLAAVSANKISAEGDTDGSTTLVQQIAARFGLKQADVQSAFDDFRTKRQAQGQQRLEDRLNQDVADGKLTPAQKELILNKHQELQSKRGNKPDNWFSLSPEERRSYMDAQRQEMQTWAKDNGIDTGYFFGGFGRGRMGMGNCLN